MVWPAGIHTERMYGGAHRTLLRGTRLSRGATKLAAHRNTLGPRPLPSLERLVPEALRSKLPLPPPPAPAAADLQRLAQPHLVGQDGVDAALELLHHPGQALQLVLAQRLPAEEEAWWSGGGGARCWCEQEGIIARDPSGRWHLALHRPPWEARTWHRLADAPPHALSCPTAATLPTPSSPPGSPPAAASRAAAAAAARRLTPRRPGCAPPRRA